MSTQFNVTPDERRVIEERAKRRVALRNEFLKLQSDPHRHASLEGGTVFDPAIQRYHAMRVSTFEHFKPTPKNVRWGFLMVVLPMVGYGWLLKSQRDCYEKKIRSGEVAYKDRNFKFI